MSPPQMPKWAWTVAAIVVTVSFCYVIYVTDQSPNVPRWFKVLQGLVLVLVAARTWWQAYRTWQ